MAQRSLATLRIDVAISWSTDTRFSYDRILTHAGTIKPMLISSLMTHTGLKFSKHSAKLTCQLPKETTTCSEAQEPTCISAGGKTCLPICSQGMPGRKQRDLPKCPRYTSDLACTVQGRLSQYVLIISLSDKPFDDAACTQGKELVSKLALNHISL